jgi:prepilin-type N-terminal cleavage/methylation domain-containing protein
MAGCTLLKDDGLVKSGPVPVNVIPAKAGIQSFQVLLDSRLRVSDGSGTFYNVVKDNKALKRRSQGGFTLIEMIASLALLGLLAAIFGMGLVAAVESYDFSRTNTQVAQKGQMAMGRMIRELTELTRVLDIDNSAAPYIIYERMDDSGTSIWGLFFDSASSRVLLAENPPENPSGPEGDILVDGVQGLTLSCFQGATALSWPFISSQLTTVQITLNLIRPDSSTQTQNFTTLIHLRNNGNDGGALR